MIFGDFAKALAQLSDPRFRRVLWLGIGLTVALLVAFYAGLLWLVDSLDPNSVEIPLVGPVTWLGDLLSWGSLLFMLVLSFFLMIPVASAITSLFLDDVAAAVEARHYPALPPAPRVPFWEGVRDTVNFVGLLLGANVVAINVDEEVPAGGVHLAQDLRHRLGEKVALAILYRARGPGPLL